MAFFFLPFNKEGEKGVIDSPEWCILSKERKPKGNSHSQSFLFWGGANSHANMDLCIRLDSNFKAGGEEKKGRKDFSIPWIVFLSTFPPHSPSLHTFIPQRHKIEEEAKSRPKLHSMVKASMEAIWGGRKQFTKNPFGSR